MFPGCYGTDEKRSEPMQIVAEKRVAELTEGNIETLTSVYVVETGETVESLMRRVGLTGTSRWQYDQAEGRLKIVVPPGTEGNVSRRPSLSC